MLCSKCFKEIKPGKEVQIKGSIFCQECSKKPFASCYNCDKDIHWNDKFRKNFIEAKEKWGFFWLFSSEKKNAKELIQCNDCYQEWRERKKTAERWLKAKGSIIFTLIGILLPSLMGLFFPEIDKRIKDNMPLTIFVSILFFLIITLSGPALDTDNYEFKERKKNKKITKKEKN